MLVQVLKMSNNPTPICISLESTTLITIAKQVSYSNPSTRIHQVCLYELMPLTWACLPPEGLQNSENPVRIRAKGPCLFQVRLIRLLFPQKQFSS